MGEPRAPGIRTWPDVDNQSSRRMVFVQGEPRWYIWVEEYDKRPLLSLRRDLLMLYQNGDLKPVKSKKEATIGLHVTAIIQGKMIRGRILRHEVGPQDSTSKKLLHILDVDEGKAQNVPLTEVYHLPEDMMSLSAQAVRCDLGLDCEEQFKWPQELDDMISRALKDAILLVKNTSNRPGTIPTISADIGLLNEATGAVVGLQKWLLECFSPHLEICKMDNYKPFPIGMHPPVKQTVQPANPIPFNLVQQMAALNFSPNVVGLIQQQLFGMSLGPQLCLPPIIPPGFAMPPTINGNMIPPFNISDSYSSGTPSISGSNPFLAPVQSVPPGFLPTGGTPSSAPFFSSAVPQKTISVSSVSTVGIELDVPSLSDSSEVTDSPPKKTPALPSPEPKPVPGSSTTKPSPKQSEMRRKNASSTNTKKGMAKERKVSLSSTSSSSSLNAEAVPFVPVAKPKALRAAQELDIQVKLNDVRRNYELGTVVPAFISHVWDPHLFEVNIVDKYGGKLIEIQKEMIEFYKSNRKIISSKHQAQQLCGEYVACYDSEDKTWFRAQVHDWCMEEPASPISVWAVDFGGIIRIDIGAVQPLSTKLASTTPILATICTMKNVRPRGPENSSWQVSHLKRFKELMPEGKLLYLRFDGKFSQDCWPVSVFTDAECSSQSINETLVAERCATYVGIDSDLSSEDKVAQQENAAGTDLNEWDPMEEAYEQDGQEYTHDDEDACVAVSGRKATDEIGICWPFQREGRCYKKYCTLRHVSLHPDGWTQDQEEVYKEAIEGLDVPQPGESVKMVVSRVLSVNRFMAMLQGRGKIYSKETLGSVLKNINSSQMKRSLKTFTVFPAYGEVVLARNANGDFYRARVVDSHNENEDIFEVMNVDTGTPQFVLLKDLRVMDPAFLHYPFQAVECWLADVVPANSEREWIKTCNTVFADFVKGKKMTASIIRSAPWGLEVDLYDDDNNRVIDYLTDLGMLQMKKPNHLPASNSAHLPG